ncbi:DUF599 domain-containing protein [Fuscibacter oryzae]|uniref:DUF599 domain-containing protein n=1 Tax=Fuscibacter oryzae TaxID=2803939 RepID=A0A8J7SUT8_9RHOB|nr:DUF599 domain-containing protein [Fuscibacter oryzae]MBL4928847.1 DUF599 domain-containing protein [Fuscibacter oryzae]
MTALMQIGPFGLPDLLAFALLLAVWLGVGWWIEHPPAGHPSVSVIVERYRREWMQQFITRQPRIFDASIIDNLRQGTAFFASASMIAIGGGVALIGNPGPLLGLTHDLTQTATTLEFQLRILPMLGFLANALLKFIWSHRLFGYCAILMAAVPNDHTDPMAGFRAAQAAEVNIHAARNFNRGMRSIYFALGALGALIGPWVLIATTLAVSGVIVRREFASQSREIMLRKGPAE